MKEYGELLAGDPAWSARAHAFSARVRDVSQVLVEIGEPRAVRHPLRARSSITTPAISRTRKASGRSRAICCARFQASRC